jgi:hypothetical protein
MAVKLSARDSLDEQKLIEALQGQKNMKISEWVRSILRTAMEANHIAVASRDSGFVGGDGIHRWLNSLKLARSFHGRKTARPPKGAPQIPPLRCAPVGMTMVWRSWRGVSMEG